MKIIIAFFASIILLQTSSFSQHVIEGDELLTLIGKPLSHPLFQQLKAQESFISDAWDSENTLYIYHYEDQILEIEFQNGKLQYQSADRYGIYRKKLPLKLYWSMTPDAIEKVLGKTVLVNEESGTREYNYLQWRIKFSFENDKIVAVGFKINPTAAKKRLSPKLRPQANKKPGKLKSKSQ